MVGDTRFELAMNKVRQNLNLMPIPIRLIPHKLLLIFYAILELNDSLDCATITPYPYIKSTIAVPASALKPPASRPAQQDIPQSISCYVSDFHRFSAMYNTLASQLVESSLTSGLATHRNLLSKVRHPSSFISSNERKLRRLLVSTWAQNLIPTRFCSRY